MILIGEACVHCVQDDDGATDAEDLCAVWEDANAQANGNGGVRETQKERGAHQEDSHDSHYQRDDYPCFMARFKVKR